MESTNKIYFIPGLATDTRIYEQYVFHGYEMVYLNFIAHNPKETIREYALRLANHYAVIPNQIIIGTSLGGILGVEIANHLPMNQVHIISSLKGKEELTSWYRIGKYFPIYKWIPNSLFKKLIISNTRVLKKLDHKYFQNFSEMVHNANPAFIKWAVDAVLRWDNEQVPQGLIHYHGTSDRLFNINHIKTHKAIPRGSHFMLVTHRDILHHHIQNALPSLA